MSWIDDHILVLHGWAAAAIVFTLPALDASLFIGFIFPGETAVLLGGVLAYNHRIALAGVLAAAIAGAVIGDSIGYAVGKRWGEQLLGLLPERLVKPAHVARGKEMVRRLGGRAVFVGRFISVLRALVPGLAGVSGIRYPTFLLWNVTGGALWAAGYILLGYLAGNAWHSIESDASLAGWVLLGVIVAGIVALILWRRRRGAGHPAVTEAEEALESDPVPEQEGASDPL